MTSFLLLSLLAVFKQGESNVDASSILTCTSHLQGLSPSYPSICSHAFHIISSTQQRNATTRTIPCPGTTDSCPSRHLSAGRKLSKPGQLSDLFISVSHALNKNRQHINRTSKTHTGTPYLSHFNERNQLESGNHVGTVPVLGTVSEWAEVTVTAQGQAQRADLRPTGNGSEFLFDSQITLNPTSSPHRSQNRNQRPKRQRNRTKLRTPHHPRNKLGHPRSRRQWQRHQPRRHQPRQRNPSLHLHLGSRKQAQKYQPQWSHHPLPLQRLRRAGQI